MAGLRGYGQQRRDAFGAEGLRRRAAMAGRPGMGGFSQDRRDAFAAGNVNFPRTGGLPPAPMPPMDLMPMPMPATGETPADMMKRSQQEWIDSERRLPSMNLRPTPIGVATPGLGEAAMRSPLRLGMMGSGAKNNGWGVPPAPAMPERAVPSPIPAGIPIGGSIGNAAPPGTAYNYGTPQGPVQQGELRPRPYSPEGVYGYQGQHDTNEGGQMTVGPNGEPRLGDFSQPAIVGGKPQYGPSPQFQQQARQDDFDMRWNQQNNQGRSQQSGGTSFGMGGRVLPGPLNQNGQLPTDGGVLGGAGARNSFRPSGNPQQDGAYRAAMNGGRIPQQIPLEQQGFARGQGFGQYGQQLPGAPQQPIGNGGYNGPMYGQEQGDGGQPTDQYGLRRPLGTGNIVPNREMAPGVLGQPQQQGLSRVIGTLPNSTVMDVDGRRVVMGNKPDGTPRSPGEYSRQSNQQVYETYLRNKAANPEAYAKSKERHDRGLAALQAKRDAFQAAKRGGRPLPVTPGADSVKPLASTEPIDVAAPKLAKADMTHWNALGVKTEKLHEATGKEIYTAIGNPAFGTRGKEKQDSMKDDARRWIINAKDTALTSGIPADPFIPELEAMLDGDAKKAMELRKKREAQEKQDRVPKSGPGSPGYIPSKGWNQQM